MAKAGAIPMYWGSSACVAEATTRARGAMPNDSAAEPLARMTALAPSLRADEFPAVIWVVFGCGGNPAKQLAVVSPRMPSSCSNVQPGCSFVLGISDWVDSVSPVAQSHGPPPPGWCERSANASISSRVNW